MCYVLPPSIVLVSNCSPKTEVPEYLLSSLFVSSSAMLSALVYAWIWYVMDPDLDRTPFVDCYVDLDLVLALYLALDLEVDLELDLEFDLRQSMVLETDAAGECWRTGLCFVHAHT